MTQYGVQCCVVEINPNFNDAKRFAQVFPGKVFLCDSFGAVEDGMIQWSDQGSLSSSERRTTEEARERYRVRIDQFKCMQSSMARFVRAECLMPEPQELVQEIIDKGVRQTAAVLLRAFTHFTKTALVTEKDEEKGTNQYKRVVRKIGIDPHHSYANMLCDVAMSRAYGMASFLFFEDDAGDDKSTQGAAQPPSPAGLPGPITALIEEIQATHGVCAGCRAYIRTDDGKIPRKSRCSLRMFDTAATEPACELFEPTG
jgi:hypothetical protein